MNKLFLPTLLLAAFAVRADRYTDYMAQTAAHGDYVQPRMAVYYGTDADEELLGAVRLGNGGVLAYGNTWGKDTPLPAKTRVLGRGTYLANQPLKLMKAGKRNEELPDRSNPNAAAFFVQYGPDLKEIREIVRFDNGLLNLSWARVDTRSGEILLAGRATDAFQEMLRRNAGVETHAFASDGKSKAVKSGACHGVLASLDVRNWQFNWVQVFEHRGQDPKVLHVGSERIIFTLNQDWWTMDPQGKNARMLDKEQGSDRLLTVSPDGNLLVAGGQNNPGTGREPWWRPYVHGFDADGKMLWELYGWDGGVVGHDALRLVSDSYVRNAAFDPQGRLVLIGSSDGGNSVFTRDPLDLRKAHGGSEGMAMSSWGMNVGQVSYVLRLDLDEKKVLANSPWIAYLPPAFAKSRNLQPGKPNTIHIYQVFPLVGGDVALAGTSATGLIETPNALFPYPNEGEPIGGPFFTVLSADFSKIRFSSYLPDLLVQQVQGGTDEVLVTGAAFSQEGAPPKTPLPGRPAFGGGTMDGFILLLK